MTLSQRIILLVFGVLVLVFISTLSISISNTRDYLDKQLQLNSQNTAISLGNVLRDSIATADTETLKTIVIAVYDRGYYKSIRVEGINGKVLAKKESEQPTIKDVPNWFVNWINLNTPSGKYRIIARNSFENLGHVKVTAHPGLAYKKLWHTFVDNLIWLCIIGVIAFTSVFFLVRILLKPLVALEAQANEIAKGNFVIQNHMPHTPELLSVAKTMNKMSTKVSQMLQAQTELTENMRIRSYQDSLTGLKNRRYFAERLDHLIKTPEEFQCGCLMLIEVSEFKEYNQQYGYVKGDELLEKIADMIKDSCGNVESSTLARVSGASFSVLLPNIQYTEAKEYAQQIHDQFESLHYKNKIDNVASTHLGIAFYDGKQDSTELLSMADMALRAAQIKGANVWHMYDDQNISQENVHSASAWREIIENVINNKSLELHFQPVRSLRENQVIHYEVLARLPDKDGNLVMASTFLPMAQQHGLISGIDIVVIEKLLDLMGDENQINYAVNISKTSLADAEFIDWLERTLQDLPGRAEHIVFETPEYSVATHIDEIRDNIHRLREMGCRFSIDHFGTGTPDFGYLLNTKIDYIKIDGSYIHGIENSDDNKFFVKSITEIAHGLDIEVIGEYVESEQEWKTLESLNIDGGQGHFIGRPTADLAPNEVYTESINQ